MHDKILRRALPVVVAVALLGACSNDDGGDAAEVDSASTDEPADITAQPDDEQEDTDESTEPATETGDDGEDTGGRSLGSSTGQLRASAADSTTVPLRIDVTSLERNGELVELAMTLTNEHEDVEFAPEDNFNDLDLQLQDALATRFDISAVRLIDQGERRAYLPVIDSEDVCLCSNGLGNTRIAAGESHELRASFGGIRDNVTTLDLEVPGFSAIAGLEVQG